MSSRTVRVYVEDTLDPKSRTLRKVHGYGPAVRDTLLNAIPNGKCLVLGRVWSGDLKPFVDGHMSALEPIVSGFTLGRTLNAEGSDTLNLGRVWLGALSERIASAVSNGSTTSDGIDIGPLAAATANLQEAIETGRAARAADAFRAMRTARDALGREEREVQEALQHDGIAAWNAGTRESIRSMQCAADKKWNGAAADPTTASAVRDGLHAAATATTEPGRLAALNDVNKSFWAGRTSDRPAVPPRTSVPQSLAQMNERNRAFWANR